MRAWRAPLRQLALGANAAASSAARRDCVRSRRSTAAGASATRARAGEQPQPAAVRSTRRFVAERRQEAGSARASFSCVSAPAAQPALRASAWNATERLLET